MFSANIRFSFDTCSFKNFDLDIFSDVKLADLFVKCEMLFSHSQTSPCFLLVCSTSLLKTVGKREIVLIKQFLLFPQQFLSVWKIFQNFHQI